MMKENDENIDLALALSNSNNGLRTRLNSERGAGVNAGARVDMAFAASDPLSELVWSPHKGLSLRCADSSLSDKKPFLLWNIGPSNLIQCPPQRVGSREDNDNKSADEGNLIVSEVAFHLNRQLVKETGLPRSPLNKSNPAYGTSPENRIECTGKDEEMNLAEEVCETRADQNDRHLSENEKDNLQNSFICNMDGSKDCNAGEQGGRTLDFLICGSSDRNFGLALSKPLSSKLDEKTSTSCSGRIEDIAGGSKTLSAGIAMASEAPPVKRYAGHVSPLQCFQPQLEAEKEFTMAHEHATGNKMVRHCFISGSALEKLEFTAENDLLPQVKAEVSKPSDKRFSGENALESPTNSRMDLYRRKGKEKALSEGNVFKRASNDEEDSHGSVESSTSAGLFAKGRKRWNLEESIAGSKRARKETEDTPASTSTVRRDSSFINWISNMVKGYSRVKQDEDPCLALTMGHCDLQQENDLQDIVARAKKSDAGCSTMGFRNIFQSLYCPTMRKPDHQASEVEDSRVESNELVLSKKASVQVPRAACSIEKGNSCEKNSLSIANGLSSQLRIMPVNAAPLQEVSTTNSRGNKASSDRGFHHSNERVDLSNPLYNQRSNIPENNSSDLISEGKAIYGKPEGNCNLGSLWITRLTTKNSSTNLKLHYGNQNEHGLSNDNQNVSNIHNEQKTSDTGHDLCEGAVNVLSKDFKRFSEAEESSACNQKSTQKLDPILPSPECKSSEAMASVFARRLDALKLISPSDMKAGTTTSGMKTCLFCGRLGHDLRYCSDTTESDLEVLLGNINAYGSIEGSSCFCILCFQLDHWANTCPRLPLVRQQKLKQITSPVDDANVLTSEGNKKYSSLLEKKGGDRPLNLTVTCSDFGNRMRNAKEEIQALPACNFVSKKMADVPKGLFDAIRKLRLSRAEVLKWMNSNVSLSYLDGFFLRLRLGKWEAGLGGTGYYVACITGGQNETSAKHSKTPISVHVGGIQCSVGIQYVSNQDFLEDELVAWWCRMLINGAKIPSKEDLRSKFKERVKLGF